MFTLQVSNEAVAQSRWSNLPDGELDDLMDNLDTFSPASECGDSPDTGALLAALVYDEIEYGRDEAHDRRMARADFAPIPGYSGWEQAMMGANLLRDYYETQVWGLPGGRQ